MHLSRCQAKIKASLQRHTRELRAHLYMTQSLPEVFSVTWRVCERIAEKLEMAAKWKKRGIARKQDEWRPSYLQKGGQWKWTLLKGGLKLKPPRPLETRGKLDGPQVQAVRAWSEPVGGTRAWIQSGPSSAGKLEWSHISLVVVSRNVGISASMCSTGPAGR